MAEWRAYGLLRSSLSGVRRRYGVDLYESSSQLFQCFERAVLEVSDSRLRSPDPSLRSLLKLHYLESGTEYSYLVKASNTSSPEFSFREEVYRVGPGITSVTVTRVPGNAEHTAPGSLHAWSTPYYSILSPHKAHITDPPQTTQ